MVTATLTTEQGTEIVVDLKDDSLETLLTVVEVMPNIANIQVH